MIAYNFIYACSRQHDLSVYPVTFDLGGIERLNQGHCAFIGLCIIIIDNVLLDSRAVRPRGLLIVIFNLNLRVFCARKCILVWHPLSCNIMGLDGTLTSHITLV